jgi:4'-phosphopantetheinyl transferase
MSSSLPFGAVVDGPSAVQGVAPGVEICAFALATVARARGCTESRRPAAPLKERIDAVAERRRASDAALRWTLAKRLGCTPEQVAIRRDERGKPRLDGFAAGALHFSVSRSEDLCVIATSESRPVGVDVERLRPFPELEAVAARHLDPIDAARVLRRKGADREWAFFASWTKREAALKAAGLGIGRATASTATACDVAEIAVMPGYAAAVAWFDRHD